MRDTGVQSPLPNQRSARGWALRDQGSASVRLAYGYAQYGYAQLENFLISPNTPAGGPGTISYQPSPLLLLRRYHQPWGAGQGGCALACIPPSAGPRAHAMWVRARGPGGREPDKENATYGAFGHGEPGLDRYGLAAGPGNGSGRTFRRTVLAELRE